MKYAIAAIAVVAALAGGAIAQTTPAPEGATTVSLAPPAPVPASACPAYPATPALPEAASLRNQKAINAGTETVNNWTKQYQVVHNCRLEEINRLRPVVAQFNARVDEAKNGQQIAIAKVGEWQGTIDTVTAAQQKKKK